MPAKPSAKPRRRLDASAARELILDVTEKRLADAGPAGIRLQEVAADAGLSHPTVLHHFGSREGLVKAVIERSIHAISKSLVEAIAASSGNDQQLEAILDTAAAALERGGHARIVLWLILEGHRIEETEMSLKHVVDATHELRLKRIAGTKKPKREDTAHMVVLLGLALLAGTVMGPMLLERAGLGEHPRSSERFRSWLARVAIGHFDGFGV